MLMNVPMVYGILPEINVFVFVFEIGCFLYHMNVLQMESL